MTKKIWPTDENNGVFFDQRRNSIVYQSKDVFTCKTDYVHLIEIISFSNIVKPI